MKSKYPMVDLGDVLDRVERLQPVEATGVYPMLGVRSFGAGAFATADLAGTETSYTRLLRVDENDIVYPKLMAWEGAFARVPADLRGRFVSTEFCTFEPKSGVDPRFVEYALRTPWIADHVAGASGGTNVRRRQLYPDDFLQRTIPLPDIDKQRHIAAHLDTVMALSGRIGSLHDDSAVRLAALAPSLAAQPGVNDSDRVAAGWQRRPLGEVMNPVVDQIAVEASGSYPNLGVYSFGRGLFEKPPIEGTNTSAKVLNRVRGGQFIYSRLFAFEGAYAYVPDRFDGYVVSGEFPTFFVDPELATAQFIAAALRSPRAWEDLRGSSRGLGLRRQRVQAESLLAYEMWFPPIEVQQRLVAGIDRASEALQRLERSREITSALVPAALNRAFAGMA